MNKAITTVLVTGATVAGVAGVLVLNPGRASFGALPEEGSQGSSGSATSGSGTGTGTGTGTGSGFGASGSGEWDDESYDESGGFGTDEDDEHDDYGERGDRGGFGGEDEDFVPATPLTPQTTGSAGSAGSSSTGGSGTSYTGSTYSSPWGAMQVSITVSGGKITDIQWEQVPQSDGHSYRINSYAAPLLVEQGLQAQSASVDGVSGATYTTEGFRTSLQSAIKKAGL